MNTTRKIKVAYAEDHELVRTGIVDLLNSSTEVEVKWSAENGKCLITMLQDASELPDVCIVDINMPEMNGFETTERIKQKWPEVGVLALSVFENELYLLRMIACGGGGFLSKNSTKAELIHAIQSIYEHGVYYANGFSRSLKNAFDRQLLKLVKVSDREAQLLKLICSEYSYDEIAKQLGVSTRTVEGYRDSLFSKLNIHSRVGLALFAIQFGYAPLEFQQNIQGR